MTSKAPLGVVTRALTCDDIKLFFEAIGEYGKDFQKIEQYMAQKSQNRDQVKNRDQIRNFYRNLYGKLAQLDIIDKLDERVDKLAQELYLLINYGEIWKRLEFKVKFRFDKGTRKLLDELVHQGHTGTFRYKNKNIRLRTPSCKALKKLNEIGIDEKVKVVTSRELPKDVLVEFYPSTTRDWLKVQSLSQNPRLRAKLSIQKRISSVLEFLENKWQVSLCSLKNVNEKCNGGENNNDIQDSKITSNVEQIRLKPSSQHELNEINVTRVVPDSHLDLSLSAYTKKMGERPNKLPAQLETATLTTPDSSILFENSSTSDRPSIDQARKHLNIFQNLASSIVGCDNSRTFCDDTQDRSLSGMVQTINNFEQQATFAPNNNNVINHIIEDQLANMVDDKEYVKTAYREADPEFNIPVPPPNFTLGEWFGKCDGGDINDNDNHDSVKNGNNQNAHSNSIMNHMIEIKKLADGWIRRDNTSLTIGELYLAFKCPEKIVLEYHFEDEALEKSSDVNSLMFKLLIAATVSLSPPETKEQLQPAQNKKKLKRQTSNADDIEATNKRVEEALKQLQPSRIKVHKRAR